MDYFSSHVVPIICMILFVVSIFPDNAQSIRATRVHHSIMKRQTSALPPTMRPTTKMHPDEHGNPDVYSNHSDTMKLFITPSQISLKNETTVATSLKTARTNKGKSKPEATPAAVQSSKDNYTRSMADFSHHPTSVRSAQQYIDKHHEYNHSHHHHHHHHDHKPIEKSLEHHNNNHQHHRDHKPMEKSHEHHSDNHHHHHHHDLKPMVKSLENHQHEHKHEKILDRNDQHHHHNSHHHSQNDHHEEATKHQQISTVPESPRTIKQPTQAPKITNPTMTLATVLTKIGTSTASPVQISLPVATMETSVLAPTKVPSSPQNTSSAAQKTLTFSHEPMITKSTLMPLSTLPVKFPVTKNEISGATSAAKPKEKVVTLLSTLKTSAKVKTTPTLKPTENETLSLSNLKPTNKVNFPPTVKSNLSNSTLQPLSKVNISSKLQVKAVNITSTLKLAVKVNTSSTFTPIDKVNSSSTVKSTEKVTLSTLNSTVKTVTLSMSKSTGKIVTSPTLRSKDGTSISLSMNGTTNKSSVSQAKKMTASFVEKEAMRMNSTTKLSDCVSKETKTYNITSSTMPKTQTGQKKLTMNLTLSQNKNQTVTISPSLYQYGKESKSIVNNTKSNTITFKHTVKEPEKKGALISLLANIKRHMSVNGANKSSGSENMKSATILTPLPSTMNASTIIVNSTYSSFSAASNSSIESSRVKNYTYSSTLSAERSTNATSNQDRSTTVTSKRSVTNPTNSSTVSMNGSSLSTHPPENYTFDSDLSVSQATPNDTRLANHSDVLLSQSTNDTDILLSHQTVNDRGVSLSQSANDTDVLLVQSTNDTTASFSQSANDTNVSLSHSNVTQLTTPTATIASSSSRKRRRSRKTTKSSTTLSTDYYDDVDDDLQDTTDTKDDTTDTTTQTTWLGDTFNMMGLSSTNYFPDNDYDSTTSSSDFDDTPTSTYSYNDYDEFSTQSSSSYTDQDGLDFDDINTARSSTNYDDDDDDWRTQSTSGYDYGNNKDPFDDGSDSSTQNPYNSNSASYNNAYDASTQSVYERDPSDYDGFDTSTQNTYRSYSEYDEGNDLSTQTSSGGGYSSNYDEGNDWSTRTTYYGFDDESKSEDSFDDNNDADYDDTTSKNTFTRTNPWQDDDVDYTPSSPSFTKDEFDSNEDSSPVEVTPDTPKSGYMRRQSTSWPDQSDHTSITEDESDSDEDATESTPVSESATQSIGTVLVTTKSYDPNLGYNTSQKRSKKRWHGYTNTIALNTTTTPYTGPSTRRKETILHQTVTRLMPGGVRYRYSKVHWNDSDCSLFNPWSRPPDLSTLFDYYKFRKVYYSKRKTFWEDVKHYFVKFVRIFKKDFRKGKRDG